LFVDGGPGFNRGRHFSRSQRDLLSPAERKREPREHRQFDVQLHTLQAAYAQRGVLGRPYA
jgi:hypothetical protein